MERNAISVPVKEWGTTNSKYNPDNKLVNSDEFTAGTRNIESASTGALEKRPGGVPYSANAFAAKIQDQYEAIFSDGARHLLVQEGGRLHYSTGDTLFTQVASGFAADTNFEFATTQDRVYFCNGINSPQVYDRTTNYGGVVYVAPQVKTAGAQAPVSAPSVAVVATGNVPVGAHTYKITYLYYEGEESNGGPASLTATTTPGNQKVNLTAIAIGGYGVIARKIYRDNADGVYVLVGTITDNVTTVFSDTAAGGTTPMPTDQGAPPVFGLITLFLNRLFVSKVTASPYTVFFSEVEAPDIFSEGNTILCNQEDPITGIIVYQDKIIVFNRKSFGQILGQTSDQFRYSHIPGSVGCVDNRTIQIRTIDGIPVIVWLSDKGFYAYNGQSVNYISEDIEDVVNLNIQQASQQKGQNTQASQLDFQQGTASGGIDLITDPGFITTPNPKRSFSTRTQWETGLHDNLSLVSGDNQLKAILTVNPLVTNVAGYSVTGDMVFNPTPRLSVFANNTGAGALGNNPVLSGPNIYYTQQIANPARAGNLTSIKCNAISAPLGGKIKFYVWADSSGSPGPILLSSPEFTPTSSSPLSPQVFTWNFTLPVLAGQQVWIGVQRIPPPGPGTGIILYNNQFTNPIGTTPKASTNGTTWSNFGTLGLGFVYTFAQTPVGKNGTWQTPVFDALSNSTTSATISVNTTNLANFGVKSQTFIIEASVDGVSFTTVFSSASLTTFSSGVSLAGHRYFRFRWQASTTDDRETNVLNSVSLTFPNPVTWTSPGIDCTSDVTAYAALDIVSSAPSGTTLLFEVATSTDNISYSGFGPIGSAIVRRYVKIRVTLTKNAGGTVTPSVTSIVLKWTIVANLISQAIDTAANPPAGWDVFQITSTGNVTVQQRSSATLIGLAGATFFTVTNGAFPPASLTPLRYTQWKVILTSQPDLVPTVDSVTVTWFIGQVKAIRPASLFHDRSYFMSAASFGSLNNDLLFEFDLDNKWRIHSGATITTFSFFYNEPYYGSTTINKIFKFAQGLLDDGVRNIVFDARSKAFDFTSSRKENSDTMKTIQDIWIVGSGTGCTYAVYYSVDNGLTFIQMLDQMGTPTYTTMNDGNRFVRRFRADYSNGQPVSGRTLMWRIVSQDAFDVKLHNVKMEVWVRNQRFFI